LYNELGGIKPLGASSEIEGHGPDQKQIAQGQIAKLNSTDLGKKPLVTEVVPFQIFHRAEDYHKGYFRQNPGQPYCSAVIGPKVAKFRKQYAGKLQT
jgi:peptide-methionine (S)-S-oxide reductase